MLTTKFYLYIVILLFFIPACASRNVPDDVSPDRGILAEAIRLAVEMPEKITSRVSVTSEGLQKEGPRLDDKTAFAISANSRYVAFDSFGTNLVENDTNETSDVFLRDRLTGETTRVSIASDGTQRDDYSAKPSISADGRYIAFESGTSDSVNAPARNIFLHDRDTKMLLLVSVSLDGIQGNGDSWDAEISADGRYITFTSDASDLVVGDTNGLSDVFVYDRKTGVTALVSIASDGSQANLVSGPATISADGRYVAFASTASNLVENDSNLTQDIFVHDRETGETTRVSTTTEGVEANNHSQEPVISADGNYVAFTSLATNLTRDDTNDAFDIFLHDRENRTTTHVSAARDGTSSNAGSWSPSLTADSRSVVFVSFASNLVDGGTRGVNTFLYSIVPGTITHVPLTNHESQWIETSYHATSSADGTAIIFASEEPGIVEGDTNEDHDVFVRQLRPLSGSE